MTSPLAPGMSAEIQITVTRELTADTLGNPGVLVFATPYVVTFLENGEDRRGPPRARHRRQSRALRRARDGQKQVA